MLRVVTGILILLLLQERGVVCVMCSRRRNVTYWILTLCDLNTCTVLCDSHVVTGSVDERTCSSIVCLDKERISVTDKTSSFYNIV
jgi:hypothetical protein